MRDLLAALDRTIARLSGDTAYSWGHMGMCNCGHLAQSITGLTQAEIHASALEREGDWEAQANRYCPSSGLLIDTVLAAMFALGLTRDDIRHLEKLSDPNVLRGAGRTYLRRNQRDDVLVYLKAWREVLDEANVHSDRSAPDRGDGASRPADGLSPAVTAR
ncbi:MAG TPA: hypothetical protein VJZ76_02580 [Thermoanaerobaculia bacterium]|nr:hypothetical protein [Thermoanaerobaculia bacterium]